MILNVALIRVAHVSFCNEDKNFTWTFLGLCLEAFVNIVSSTESIYEKFVFKAFASNVSNSVTVHAVAYIFVD